jgi:hypothetical protein
MERNSKPLSDALKYILQGRFELQHGIILRDDNIAFLEGVQAGTSNKQVKKDIITLIKAIETRGPLELTLQY